ncbi:ATP phosphoribosyltransferase regulatory subunit [Thermococcus piezophilus]|uniref:Histidine--tRNA ligase n=1 Tax=Thermococcus piezophilus TaxID=1712654 RepID=A0A172WJA1_9EURY|nr:ATP phosphoribosyltransferase regulatory subunit [Thermococcus piezophilus]ANF23548.1 ATP phosphoribosyltransferase regulatory subunit [Thermococcus piezophilus]
MKKDLLSESERLAYVTKYLRRTFELWGYREILLPAIEEFSEQLRKGTKFAYNNGFYIIKPDLTSQILANLKEPRKLKLYYISEVLNGGIKGKWQAGVEFIGGKDIKMQVEVLLAVITSLEALGIEDFYIDVGSLKVWEGAIEGIEEFRAEIFRALTRRNFEIIERLPISGEKKEELWQLFNFRGKSCKYKKLNKIIEAVDDERVFIDFGTIRPLPYYSDIIFEVYSPKIGKPLGGGGEYTFKGVSAFGFAFDLDALSKLFDGKIEKSRKRIGGELKEAYRLAKELVKLGIPVEVE